MMKTAAMSSRERVRLALEHREPDRAPFDITFTVEAYHALRARLGLPPEAEKAVGIWADVSPSLDLLDAMQIDLVYLGLNPGSTPWPHDPGDGLRYDQWGVGRAKVGARTGASTTRW